ncbi:hypothetical protein [Paenibacillus sp. FSL H8-0332]|uniref:hypothetical protein n=1 Tax=Paenibacillus sp. FSL H8-0332 TaxID=2954742 RepID=UPI0030CB0BD2
MVYFLSFFGALITLFLLIYIKWDFGRLSIRRKASVRNKQYELERGQNFPIVLTSNKDAVALFLSASCLTCHEVMENFNALRQKWCDMEFELFIRGSEEEILYLIDKHKISTHFVKLNETDKKVYGVRVLPYMYYICRNNKVLSGGIINEIKDIEKIISLGT